MRGVRPARPASVISGADQFVQRTGQALMEQAGQAYDPNEEDDGAGNSRGEEWPSKSSGGRRRARKEQQAGQTDKDSSHPALLKTP